MKNDRDLILRAIKQAGFKLVENLRTDEYILINKDELQLPQERRVK